MRGKFILGVLVSTWILVGCERADRPRDQAATQAAVSEASVERPAAPREAYRLQLLVTFRQAGLTTRVLTTCSLVRGDQDWIVEGITERLASAEGGVTQRERKTRPDFRAADPLSALGLPEHMLALSGYGLEPQRRVLRLPVGDLCVPMQQEVREHSARAVGRALLAGGPIELEVETSSRWRTGSTPLPARLIVETHSRARGGAGPSAASHVIMDLKVERESQ